MDINAGKILGTLLGGEAGNGAAAVNLPDLTELAKAIQNTKMLDPEKLSSLKTELLNLSKSGDLPGAVRLKLAPLLAAFQSVQGSTPEETQKLWDTVRPLMGDKANLSALLSMLGEHSGQILDLLKQFFLRT